MLLLGDLLGDVLTQVSDGDDVVVDLVEFARDKKRSHLVQNHCAGVQQLCLKCLYCHLLTHFEIVVVDDLDGDVDGLPGLSELDAHLVDTVDDALAALFTVTGTFNESCRNIYLHSGRFLARKLRQHRGSAKVEAFPPASRKMRKSAAMAKSEP